MTTWWRLSLGDGVMAISACADIAEQFAAAFSSAGKPIDMAVFKRHDFEDGLHCEVTLFFSPAAYALGAKFNASACPQPSRQNLELLAGDLQCWSALFRGSEL